MWEKINVGCFQGRDALTGKDPLNGRKQTGKSNTPGNCNY